MNYKGSKNERQTTALEPKRLNRLNRTLQLKKSVKEPLATLEALCNEAMVFAT
jgi:hypothetical protein